MNTFKGVKGFIILLLLFVFIQVHAQSNQFNFSPLCLDAAREISLLKLKPAAELLAREKLKHPENCAVDYLENYIDFYTLITNQDLAELRKLETGKAMRSERIAKLDPSSPYRLYGQAEIQLQWAFSRIFQGEFLTAAFEFRSAYRLLEENSRRFPSFSPNQKDLGMLKAMFGTVPENLQWVLRIVGIKGDFREGMLMLKNYIEQSKQIPEQILEKQSGEYYSIFLQLNFGDKEECWKFCEKVTRDYRQNLLSCYLRTFTGIKTAHNDESIQCIQGRPASNEYIIFPILDYYAGVAYLNHLDENSVPYLKKYVSLSKGKNLIKEAYKRLSWYYLISGDPVKSKLYRNMIKKYGAAISNEDKIALKEAESGITPDITLLRARLLCDGGYYSLAEATILSRPSQSYNDLTSRIEYYYRLGRIMQEEKKLLKAIENYQQVIGLSGNLNLNFAPASCLQLGAIYEQSGNKLMAKKYYEKALKYDYQYGMNQQARAGLIRNE